MDSRTDSEPWAAATGETPDASPHGDFCGDGNFKPDAAPEPMTVEAEKSLIRQVLRQIATDGKAPAAARAQAARTLAEMLGALGRHAPPPAEDAPDVASMSRAELERELARSRG